MQKYAFAKIYKMNEIRLTSARKAILEHLEDTSNHSTAIDIHEALQTRLPSLNLTTVYRSLEYLVKHNLISVADIGIGSPVYEKISGTPHHHLICHNCNKIQRIDHSIVAPFFEELDRKLGFKVRTNHLVLYGTCKGCQQI